MSHLQVSFVAFHFWKQKRFTNSSSKLLLSKNWVPTVSKASSTRSGAAWPSSVSARGNRGHVSEAPRRFYNNAAPAASVAIGAHGRPVRADKHPPVGRVGIGALLAWVMAAGELGSIHQVSWTSPRRPCSFPWSDALFLAFVEKTGRSGVTAYPAQSPSLPDVKDTRPLHGRRRKNTFFISILVYFIFWRKRIIIGGGFEGRNVVRRPLSGSERGSSAHFRPRRHVHSITQRNEQLLTY